MSDNTTARYRRVTSLMQGQTDTLSKCQRIALLEETVVALVRRLEGVDAACDIGAYDGRLRQQVDMLKIPERMWS